MTNETPVTDDLVRRAKALLEAGISPWPWKSNSSGGMRTVDDQYSPAPHSRAVSEPAHWMPIPEPPQPVSEGG